jgi:hypothetical protein
MKKLLIFMLSCSLIGTALADSKSTEEKDPKKAEMMKAWQEAATPGAEHAMLKELVGKWQVTTKSWQSENAKPEVTTGTSTFKPVFGGRFIRQDFKGKMMGMPYEGTGMMGYNKVSKKFESSWYDSMSTAAMNFEGTFDQSSKTFTQSGEFECPMRKTTEKMRSELKMIDKDTVTFALYMPDMESGKEYKGMEQQYKRVK